MHICTVTPSYLPHFGGAEVGMHMVLSHLAQTTQHRFSVITSTTNPDWPRQEEIDGVMVYRYIRPRLWAKWFAPTLFGFRYNPGLIRRLQPDVLHISYLLPGGVSAWYTARRRKIPVVLSLGGHDVYDPFNMPPWPLRRWMSHFIRRSPVIAVNSQWTKQYLVEQDRAAPEDIHVTGFGVDRTRFNSDIDGTRIREQYDIAPDTVLIFALQRLELRKGVDVLLKAIALLQEPNFHVLVGGKGRDTDKIHQLAAALGIQDHVTFCGFVAEEEKPLYYAAADIFALHSYHEGLGIVLAEAAACGKPLVATNAGGTTDIAIPGHTGLTVEPGKPEAFAAALAILINDPEQRTMMGAAAATHAAAHFSIDRVAASYLELFEQAPSSGSDS